MPEQDDDNFLMRWSRRKQAAKHGLEQPLDDVAPAAGTDATPAQTEGAEAPPDHAQVVRDRAGADVEAVPEDLVDVDVETLDYRSDFRRFMENDVPEALKKRALRQLWRSDPILANVDGLNDYDDDFTDAALAVKVLETAHRVGRGFLDDEDVPDDATVEGAEDVADPEPDDTATVAEAAKSEADGTDTELEAEDDIEVADAGDDESGVRSDDGDERPDLA